MKKKSLSILIAGSLALFALTTQMGSLETALQKIIQPPHTILKAAFYQVVKKVRGSGM